VNDNGREVPRFTQGAVDRVALANLVTRLIYRPGDDLVTDHVPDHAEGLEHLDATVQQGSEGPGKPRHDHALDEAPDPRDLELRSIDGQTAPRRAAPELVGEEQAHNAQQDRPPPLAHELRQVHQELRGRRQRAAEVLEDLLEPRHEKRHQQRHGERADADEHQGISQSGHDLRTASALRLLEVSQPREDLGELAGGLAGPDHTDVQGGEHPWVCSQRIRKGRAAGQVLGDLVEDLDEDSVLGVLRQGVDAPQQGQAGPHQVGQLPGEDGQVGLLHPPEHADGHLSLVARVEGETGSLQVHLDREQPLAAELAHGGLLVIDNERPGGTAPGGIQGRIPEGRHLLHLRPRRSRSSLRDARVGIHVASGALDLVQRGDALLDLAESVLLHGGHAASEGCVANLRRGTGAQNQLLDLLGHSQDLVQARSATVARAAALIAPVAPPGPSIREVGPQVA